MPRPEQKIIQLTVDGREIQAVEGTMLVDAAKQGDVEIPYFCYEPKLGAPVGACRMCLVEIEGIPKLQTSCSTAVRDGMVVHTESPRVKEAQGAIVEFLLVNHPLDCPVCDKGGECPLQDITFGWGKGISRVVEPKRHFQKPLALSPLIAIDRERCILCYRCVRFSQEVAEDWQLIFTERGAHTFVGTHDGHPYSAPFSGNIIELCPVGALTSRPYRFRARPWDIEGAAGVCTLCPSQCNVEFTVRDERVVRVLARDNPDVDDGWLCDKGRFAYQAIHVDERITRPLVREGTELRPVSWQRAIESAAAISGHKGRAAALVGGQATNEEAFLLQRLLREGLDSHDIDSRLANPAKIELEVARKLASKGLGATVPDLEFAHTVLVLGTEPLDDSPILDLRIRKGVRRNGVKLAVASSRPSALDSGATISIRYAPGEEAEFVAALDAALVDAASSDNHPDDGGAPGVAELARLLRDGGKDVVILWGESLPPEALPPLLRICEKLRLSGPEGSGLIEVPAGGNTRGVREAGAVPYAGPGYSDPVKPGRSAGEIAEAAAAGEIGCLYLLQVDPLRDLPDQETWKAAMKGAFLVVAHATVMTEGLKQYADVIFPAESSAEKDGTVVHPDGRLQRLRAAIRHPGEVRAGWQVIADVAKQAGHDLGVLTSPMAFKQLTESVPFYEGLTLESLGGRGQRWQESEASAAGPKADTPQAGETPGGPTSGGHVAASGTPEGNTTPAAPSQASSNGHLRLGTYRSIWAYPEVELSPALQFTVAGQVVELSPEDAGRLGIASGEEVEVAQNGTRLRGRAAVRTGVPNGTAFLAAGISEDSANALTESLVEVSKA